MKLIGVHLSPYARKVAVILTAKGLAFEQEPMLPGSGGPVFRKISPLGKIPVLMDGEFVIPDSSVICEYLEEKYPEISMMPDTPELRAQARFLEELGDSKLVETSAPIFIENFANPTFFGKEPDKVRVERSKSELLPPLLDYLDGRVPSEGFLFGGFCTADVGIVSPLLTARYGGYEIDAQRWPRLAAYAQRVESHGPVAQVLAVEKAAVAAMTGG